MYQGYCLVVVRKEESRDVFCNVIDMFSIKKEHSESRIS
jgi:hypothetical protein